MPDDLTPLRKLADGLLRETLHGAPPAATTMRLAEGVVALIDRCERAEADVAWHEDQNGTRAEQEAEDAAMAAALARQEPA